MKIAIITNFNDECSMEDFILSRSFAEDGHHVDLLNFPLNNEIEKLYDVLILKNAWDLNEKTYKNYFKQEKEFFDRIKELNIKIINTLDGNLHFDKLGKKILVDLFKKGYKVVPTIDDIRDISILPKAKEYIKKPIIGYDGFDMEVISLDKLDTINLKGEVLQPKLAFKSEVQMYFVNDSFVYALEYSPSKWPDYPEPKEIDLSTEQIFEATKFIKLNNLTCGFGRIDFLRLENDELIMLEMADSNPNMSLTSLSKETLNKFLIKFKTAVYDYLNNN